MAKGWLDNYGEQENYNNSKTSVPEGYEGEGYSMKGRNYSPAWGGQFQMGGSVYPVNYVPEAQEGKKLTFLQPTSDKLPEGYRIPYSDPSSERAMSIGGENGESAYLIPSFKYGQPLDDPMEEFRKTGEHLGGPFKTWQEADKWENETRHPAVEKGENIMFPQEQFAMGGSIPGAVGFSYARTQGAAPSKGPHRNKVDVTDASAQNGQEMKYYQEGLDFKPKTISKDGAWLDNYDEAQNGKKFKFDSKKFAADQKRNTPLQRSIDKEANSENLRLYTNTKEYQDKVKANKAAQDKATVQGRKDRIKNSEAAQDKPFTKDNWRQQLADETQATGDKFRLFPDDPDSFIDDWLNPGVFIGDMASSLGSAPLRAQQENSYMPYVTSIGVPLLTGGLEGLGAKTNKQFISNVVNPLNMVPGYHSAEKAIGKKLGNISTSISPELRQGLQTAGPSFGSNTNSKINWGKDYFEKIQNKEKELQDLLFSKKISEKEYLEGVPLYEKELAKELGLENKLGSGNYGKVFELPNDPSKVIKLGNPMSAGGTGATNWTPELIEKLKSIKQNANIAIPEQVEYFEIPSLYQGYGAKTKEVMTMPNLNQVASENLNLNKRDRYALFLKQARQLRDQGIQLDVKNIENFKFNKDKGVFDIYDVNPGYISNPGYYMQDVVNKTKGPLFEHMQFKQGGIIKDDRGQWDHPGEITEIGSNDITMEGVPYDVLGVSDTGDTKLMKPGKNYKFKGKKVTEFPMAQNGIKTFYNDYVNSPKYKERLELQNYNNPDKVISDRSKHLIKTKLNTIKDTGGFTANNTGSYYTPSTNTVDYDEFDLQLYPGTTSEDIKTHEFSHAVSALSPKNKSNLTLNKNEVTEINSRNKNKQEHEKDPEEAKADMDVLRYHLKKDKLYDTGKEEFTPELYNTAKKKYKNNQTIKRFFNRFSDKDAIYLMNSIAQLNDKDEYMPMAKNGLRQEQKGLQNLDNLTNFTNYNKPQPGGWLNKYN